MSSVDRLLHVISVDQAGAFHVDQAHAAGVTPRQLERWIDRAAGARIHRGVYAHAIVQDRVETRRWASVLAGGKDALVGGLAALDDWQLERRRIDAVEIVVCRRQRALRGTRIVESTTLVDEDRRRLHGRPTTSVERTLVDIARRRTTGQLCKLISEACFRRLLDIDRLHRTIERNRARAGIASLITALAKYLGDENGSDSRYEDRFARLLDRAGIRGYRQNVWLTIGGQRIRVDFYIPELNLVIEIDPDNHLLPDKRREDDLKSGLIRTAGLDLIRVSGRDLRGGIRAVRERERRRLRTLST